MRTILIMSALLFKGLFLAAQPEPYPGQPEAGPGGADYTHRSLVFFDHADKADGYWLFEPTEPKPESAPVIVFLHGYGAYNPFAYGKWIKHLVAKGNIVIYPRYQKNLLIPRPNSFPKNAAKGIRDALKSLEAPGRVKPNTDKVVYIGHSYGGVIASNLGVHFEEHAIPKPAGMLLCEPGSGPLKGARLEDYSGLPEDLALLVVVGEDDYVVGSEFGKLVFQTARNTPMRNLLVQRRDTSEHKWVLATHSEPYGYDMDFDTGVRNYTAKRVLSTSRLNQVDFYCYWKLGDALCSYVREGQAQDFAFGNTARQRFMGTWPNGRPLRELDVFLPGVLEKMQEQADRAAAATSSRK